VLLSVRLGIVEILTQDRCTVCAERTICLEIILDAPDGTPRRRGSSGSSFQYICRQCVVLVQDRSRFEPNEPQAWKSLWMHTMKLQGDVGHVESHFGPFGDSVTIGPFGYSGNHAAR
jgi:hypothetical protein